MKNNTSTPEMGLNLLNGSEPEQEETSTNC